ncbi:MAG: protein kinase, partial [Myxococcales bacterium]|nr:protein kinase [Myxococcales bacterium]
VQGAHTTLVLERARREVEVLEGIDSPYVVRVLSGLIEVGSPLAGVAWLEEMLDGDDLRALVGTPWSWPEARQLAIDMARGLVAFHEAQVVHRDLSPGNVRRISAGAFKLIDPGLGRHLAKATVTGSFQPGTPGFMSPEHVIVGARPLPASDVFSAGVLLFVALTGRLPIDVGGDFDDYCDRLRAAQLDVQLDHIRGDLPGAAYELVGRCLESQSARRFLDGAELLSAAEAT